MKKILLAGLITAAMAVSAKAQVRQGDVAPDFTITDINGVSHNLYKYLDSGYMVFLDISAAWCGPCWQFHQSHVMNNLVDAYGVNGTISPKKIKVLWVESEATNTPAQLTGTSTGNNYSNFSQGNWVAGAKYPIFDNNSLSSSYSYGGVPSFTVITRDRLVAFAQSGANDTMMTVPFWAAFLNNVATGAAAGPDAKMVNTGQLPAFFCQAAPTVRFQNYSSTQAIASATLKVYSGNTAISTQNWTGNLAPYAIQDVTMPAFTQGGPYKTEVTVNGDAVPANNSRNATELVLYSSATASATPANENLDPGYPAKYLNGDAGVFRHTKEITWGQNDIPLGPNEQVEQGGLVVYPNMSTQTAELTLGSFNTSAAGSPSIQFDWAFQNQNGANDNMEILESIDCGVTWTSVYSKSGSQLATVSGSVPSNAIFIPKQTSDWRHEVSSPLSKNINLILKMVARQSGGQTTVGWFDNINVVAVTTAVADVLNESSIRLYPNPAAETTTLELSIIKPTDMVVELIDMTGRKVVNIIDRHMNAGACKLNINTSNLPAGIYNVRIQTTGGSRMERLTVIK